jgi:RNA polymerase sigma-70 factor (ECF subfamily)
VKQQPPASEAVPALLESHGDRLYSLGVRFCGNHEEAEDLVQETFMLAYKNWDSFKGESSPATWLYTIASRVCQRFHRKRSGEPDHVLSLNAPGADLLPMGDELMAVVPGEDEGALADQVRRESRDAIEVAITELPQDFRMPLVLKEVAGFSLIDIATIMGIPAATVKTRLHRARLRLRQALESTLPKRALPKLAYSRQVCLDLLQAKQETLDSGVAYQFPTGIICARCSEFFAGLDLAQDVCGELAQDRLPIGLRAKLLEQARLESCD